MNEKQNIKQYFIKENKTKIIIVSAFFILVCSIVISACSWTTGGEDIVFPEENISYMHHVKPFLALNCSYSPCHSDYNRAGGVALTEYWTLFEYGGIVVPGNPDGSRLVQIIEGTLPHFTTFYTGNITENHKKGIRRWIETGAINN